MKKIVCFFILLVILSVLPQNNEQQPYWFSDKNKKSNVYKIPKQTDPVCHNNVVYPGVQIEFTEDLQRLNSLVLREKIIKEKNDFLYGNIFLKNISFLLSYRNNKNT